MDTNFVEKMCSACEQSISMKNSYGAIALHCLKVNAPNYKACAQIKSCPLGKVA